MTRGDQYYGKLHIGQKVHCILYGGRDGVIYEIQGEQRPDTIRTLAGGVVVMGGCAQVGVVFADHKTVIPEAIIRGVQWYISDEIVSPDEVQDALILQGIMAATKKRENRELEAEREKLKQSLIEKYPYLMPKNKAGNILNHVLGAKNMKKQLSIAFPDVRFSVKSKKYTGGSSITVSCPDGPIYEGVKKIALMYEKESGQKSAWVELFGGADHVFVSRD